MMISLRITMTEPTLSQLLAAINSVESTINTLKDETNADFVVLKANFSKTAEKADANARRIDAVIDMQELQTYEVGTIEQRQFTQKICIIGVPTVQDENPFDILLKIARPYISKSQLMTSAASTVCVIRRQKPSSANSKTNESSTALSKLRRCTKTCLQFS